MILEGVNSQQLGVANKIVSSDVGDDCQFEIQRIGSSNRLDVDFLALLADRTAAARVVSAQALNLRLITTARH